VNWRERWARFSTRERRLIGIGAGVLALVAVHFLIVSPFLSYREDLRDDIEARRAELENATAYLARAGDTTRRREQLANRVKQARTQLVPGDTPTLAAAALQDHLHSVANEKGVEIQSTQVMRDENVGDFKRIAVRITVTGELRPLAEFLTAVEHGSLRVSLPFLEISRRGAALRGKGARTLAATLEASAFIQGPATQDGAAPAGAAAASPGAPPASPAAPRSPVPLAGAAGGAA
jgi:Tfp pilus assembly protein PilO